MKKSIAIPCALFALTVTYAIGQQGKEPELMVHRTMALTRGRHTDLRGRTSYARVEAICDEGNGVMVYVVYNYTADESIGVAAVPNACHKAER